MCEPLMPDVVVSKVQSQLCELGGSTYGFNTQEFSIVGGYTENLKNHKTVKIGGGGGTCSGQYGTCMGSVMCSLPNLHVQF